MHLIRASLFFAAALTAVEAAACGYPDEGNMPLRRAVTRVQMLPDTLAWHRERLRAGDFVTYRLLLEETVMAGRRCYWTVEVLSEGNLWRRFHVTPDGRKVRRAGTAPAPR